MPRMYLRDKIKAKCKRCKHHNACSKTRTGCHFFQEFDMYIENDPLHKLWDNPEDEPWNEHR